MATVIAIGQPENEDERLAIRWLREKLPLSYEIYHNFEIERDGQKYEIDLAILAPHAVWLVDAKGTRGNITVYGPQWHPEGRSPFASPLPKLRQHAKSLRGMLLDSNRGRPDLDRIHFGAAIILTAPDAELVDTTGFEAGDICKLKDSAPFLQDGSRIPGNRLKDIRQYIGLIRSLIKGKAKPRSSSNRLGDYVLEQKLGETDHYVEWRGYNESAGLKSGKVRLRVYRADPYLPEAERIDQKKRIQTAYAALNRLPSHPNILGARHFFGTERGRSTSIAAGERDGSEWIRIDDAATPAIKHVDKLFSQGGHALRSFFERVVTLRLSPPAVAAFAPKHRRRGKKDLDPAGYQTAELLAALSDDERQAVIDKLRFVTAGFSELISHDPNGPGDQRYFFVKEEIGGAAIEIPAWVLSEGTRRLTSILAVALQDQPPPLLSIEEVENGFDPWTLRFILEELVACSERGTQILLTTHSPYLMNLLPREVFHFVDRSNEGAQFSRITGEEGTGRVLETPAALRRQSCKEQRSSGSKAFHSKGLARWTGRPIL